MKPSTKVTVAVIVGILVASVVFGGIFYLKRARDAQPVQSPPAVASLATIGPGSVYDGPAGTIHLLNGECVDQASRDVVRALREDPQTYRAAKVAVDGENYAGCFKVIHEIDAVCVVAGVGHIDLPVSAFKKVM